MGLTSGDALRALTDTALSPASCRVVLYVASLGPGQHEIKHATFFALLNHPGEKAVRTAINLAIDCGYLVRSAGGRGRSDMYEFSPAPRADLIQISPAEIAALNNSPAPEAGLSALSPAPRADLSADPPPYTTNPPPPPNAGAREPGQDLDRLRNMLGGHASAVDQMLASANHPPGWAAAVLGKYGPTGTQAIRLSGIPPARQVAVVATALMEWATGGRAFENRYFDGYIRKAADNERNGGGGTGGHGTATTRPALRAVGGSRGRFDVEE